MRHASDEEACMTYVIVEPCIGEKNSSCVDVCPVSCIYEAEEMYYINPDECIECGACEPECPSMPSSTTARCPTRGRAIRTRTANSLACNSLWPVIRFWARARAAGRRGVGGVPHTPGVAI